MVRRTTGRSITRHHAEWLNLIEISGPFLSLPVLLKVFPQGLDIVDSDKRRVVRTAYEEWESVNSDGQFDSTIHNAWIDFVISDVLDLPEEVVAKGQAVPSALKAEISEHQETLRPDIVIQNPKDDDRHGRPRLLIKTYPPNQDLERPVAGLRWKASPATRMMELLHSTGYRLGLITNGERWMLVDAPRDDSTGFISWYASLWSEEPLTLQAFCSLLGVSRFFNVANDEVLEAILAESAQNQQEVTDQLGFQVRKAVEVLIQSLDKTDQDSNRSLLADIEPTLLYEAALTVMMRLVFLMAAEERGLLPLDDDLYGQNYAISTLRDQLRETADQHGEEILERRHDAWCRLLSTFRAVHGGVEHDAMRLPAYGGSLFDPDRYPFLEGRKGGTHWKTTPASPLPINNRTVMHLLEALQILQVKVPGGGAAEARRLSFRALDIEQIGHVYEGLLDHTAKRAKDVVLGIKGKAYNEPEVEVAVLEELLNKSEDDLKQFIKDVSGRTANAIKNSLNVELDMMAEQALRAACGNDKKIFERVKPFAGLLRTDTFDHPVVILPGSIYVTEGTDRRSSGTHYTPRSLTEPIVQNTLDPIVYEGPAEGKPKDEWKLKSPAEILDIKVCDMAMGSGAFLVQSCRYLSERLVEAWEVVLETHSDVPGITAEGKASEGKPNEALIPRDTDERIAYARRIIADRCLHGVDKNPLAVEMAKLSIWLITLDKGRPFTFLDHVLKCGDSLIGVDMEQLRTFSMDKEQGKQGIILQFLESEVDKAIALRRKLESIPSNDPQQIQHKEMLLKEADEMMDRLKYAADMLVSTEFTDVPKSKKDDLRIMTHIKVAKQYSDLPIGKLKAEARKALNGSKTFHWPIEFPEVFEKGGFDAIVGNPPFMGGQKITGNFGTTYRNYLVEFLANGKRGSADLCAYFFLRNATLLKYSGHMGLLATNSIAQGSSREVGLQQLVEDNYTITHAVSSRKWPGKANLEISHLWLTRGIWKGDAVLDKKSGKEKITSYLTRLGEVSGDPYQLKANENKSFQGIIVLGLGFIMSSDEAQLLIDFNPKNKDVLFPYLNGDDLNSSPDQSSSRWVINFFDWPLRREQMKNLWEHADTKQKKKLLQDGIVPCDYPGPVAKDYPDCLAIVENKVKPDRIRNNDKGAKKYWWRFLRPRPELYTSIAGLNRVLIRAQVSRTWGWALVPDGIVYDAKTIVFAYDDYDDFASFQSSIHFEWAVEYMTTLRTDMSYTPTRQAETYPLPLEKKCLCDIGHRYYKYRQNIMKSRQEGLTVTYNRFHNPKDESDDIQKLRDFHVEMDKAVARAYGWDDLDLEHGFHKTRQGLRFTISEKARQEVLQRLLKLNHERYAEEVELGLHIKGKRKKMSKKNKDKGAKLF